MALVTINSRKYFIDADTVEIEKVSNGRWKVTYDGDRSFLVVGGRESGGASHEWFCYHPEMFGETWVPKDSMIGAVRLGVAY